MDQMTNSNAGTARKQPITEERAGFVMKTGVFFFSLSLVGLSYPVTELHEGCGPRSHRGGLKPSVGGEGGRRAFRSTCTSARSLNRRSHEL